jgi:hypothetical protein
VKKRIAAVLRIHEEKERQKERLEAEERAKLQSVARTPRLKRDPNANAPLPSRTPRTPRLTESFANVDLEKTSVSLEKYAASTDLERSFQNLKISINPLLVMKHSEQQEKRFNQIKLDQEENRRSVGLSAAPTRNSLTHFGLGVLSARPSSVTLPPSPLASSTPNSSSTAIPTSAAAAAAAATTTTTTAPGSSASLTGSNSGSTVQINQSIGLSRSSSSSSLPIFGSGSSSSSSLTTSLDLSGSPGSTTSLTTTGSNSSLPMRPATHRPAPTLLSFNGQVRINPLWQMQDTPQERRELLAQFRRIKYRVSESLVKQVEQDNLYDRLLQEAANLQAVKDASATKMPATESQPTTHQQQLLPPQPIHHLRQATPKVLASSHVTMRQQQQQQ